MTRTTIRVLTLLVDKTSEITNLSAKEIMDDFRDGELIRARSMIYFVATKHLEIPVTYVARFFKKNHATTIYAIAKVEHYMFQDAGFKRELRELVEWAETNGEYVRQTDFLKERIEFLKAELERTTEITLKQVV